MVFGCNENLHLLSKFSFIKIDDDLLELLTIDQDKEEVVIMTKLQEQRGKLVDVLDRAVQFHPHQLMKKDQENVGVAEHLIRYH